MRFRIVKDKLRELKRLADALDRAGHQWTPDERGALERARFQLEKRFRGRGDDETAEDCFSTARALLAHAAAHYREAEQVS